MSLTYCFESSCIPSVLAKCRRNDLAVVGTEGQTMVIYPYFMEKNNELYSLDH